MYLTDCTLHVYPPRTSRNVCPVGRLPPRGLRVQSSSDEDDDDYDDEFDEDDDSVEEDDDIPDASHDYFQGDFHNFDNFDEQGAPPAPREPIRLPIRTRHNNPPHAGRTSARVAQAAAEARAVPTAGPAQNASRAQRRQQAQRLQRAGRNARQVGQGRPSLTEAQRRLVRRRLRRM